METIIPPLCRLRPETRQQLNTSDRGSLAVLHTGLDTLTEELEVALVAGLTAVMKVALAAGLTAVMKVAGLRQKQQQERSLRRRRRASD